MLTFVVSWDLQQIVYLRSRWCVDEDFAILRNSPRWGRGRGGGKIKSAHLWMFARELSRVKVASRAPEWHTSAACAMHISAFSLMIWEWFAVKVDLADSRLNISPRRDPRSRLLLKLRGSLRFLSVENSYRSMIHQSK